MLPFAESHFSALLNQAKPRITTHNTYMVFPTSMHSAYSLLCLKVNRKVTELFTYQKMSLQLHKLFKAKFVFTSCDKRCGGEI